MIRKMATMTMLAALAACASVPKGGFSKAQVRALEAAGFHRAGENFELGLSDRVLFAVDQADLTTETAGVVDKLAATLLAVGIGGTAIEGHTDATGSAAYNLDLSQRRAGAVRAELARAGMKLAQVRAQGLGETRPVASNDTEDGRAQNRRVVIVVTPADAIPVRD